MKEPIPTNTTMTVAAIAVWPGDAGASVIFAGEVPIVEVVPVAAKLRVLSLGAAAILQACVTIRTPALVVMSPSKTDWEKVTMQGDKEPMSKSAAFPWTDANDAVRIERTWMSPGVSESERHVLLDRTTQVTRPPTNRQFAGPLVRSSQNWRDRADSARRDEPQLKATFAVAFDELTDADAGNSIVLQSQVQRDAEVPRMEAEEART
jgi:hypothetical protein